jgi:hypothetical protein
MTLKTASAAIELQTHHPRRGDTMRKRHAFRPALDSLEDRVALSADVVQEGDFQGEFGDQTTPDAPGSAGETVEAPEVGAPAGTGITAARAQQGIAPVSPRSAGVVNGSVAAAANRPVTVAANRPVTVVANHPGVGFATPRVGAVNFLGHRGR